MKPTLSLPDDAALPGLAAIGALGLARAVPQLQLGDEPVEVLLVGYSRGLRATLEVRAGDRHFAVKCFARDPSSEADAYTILERAGLASGRSGIRVPRLLVFERPLMTLAISWLEGPTANDLITGGGGARAGSLAARWIERSTEIEATVRRAAGSGEILARADHWTSALAAADASLGVMAATLTRRLEATVQVETRARLVNGRFYVRHVLDLGDAGGVIDWGNFGFGCVEIDAGMFLGGLWRVRRHEARALEAARAEEAFLRGTAGLLDERRLAWYRAGALLSHAYHSLARRKNDWLDRAGDFLSEGARSLEAVFPAAPARRGAVHGVAPRPEAPERKDAVSPNGPETAAPSRTESITHRRAGPGRVHRTKADPQRLRHSIMGDLASLADELFEGDTAALVCQLINARDMNADDLARVIALLQVRHRELEGRMP